MKNLDQACVNTLRFLAVDQVEKAKSGHPGFPLGTAPLMYTIWDRFMNYNPANPDWFNRDRFILSPGHGSALMYAMLHVAGYDLSIEDLKNFRQWGSKTAGHPEHGLTPGVDVSTGPLGHGFAMGVGFAIAEAMLAAKYNKPGFNVVDHYTYGITSDGDQMEGVASEAASLAGTLGLGRLIYLYDDNKITIEGSTDIAFTEDIETRFKAYGWQVLRVPSSEDIEAMEAAINLAKADTEHPSLIIVRTHIGFGSPKQDSPSCHGEPLGPDATAQTKAKANWEHEAFYVPAEVKAHFDAKLPACKEAEAAWDNLMDAYADEYPELAAELKARIAGEIKVDLDKLMDIFANNAKTATRAASGDVINALAGMLPAFTGGSADLGPSNKTVMKNVGYFSKEEPAGRNIHFGVREHGMGTVLNGMSLHGGFVPFGGTFLVFADFLRPTIRMAALMEIQSIFVLTHDSIALGEDGPTHQPIETTMGLRLIPNTCVIRPADALETAVAWKVAVENKTKPTCLLLSRQNLTTLNAYKEVVKAGAPKGAYVLSPTEGEAKVIIIATGSEVELALKAQAVLKEEGTPAAVVSMPSWDLFDAQDEAYKASVLPAGVAKFAVEAGVPYGWSRYTGCEKRVLGITTFGASAPGDTMMKEYGFTVENLVAKIKATL
mgnify:FL=1